MDSTVRGVSRYLAGVAAFSLVYALVAWIGYQLVPGVAKVTPIWFPAALALTVLLVHKLRYWPGAFFGPLLFSFVIDVPMQVAIASCLGNLTAAVLGAVLLRRAGFDLALSRFQDGVRLIFLGAALPNLVGAVIGCLSLYAGGVATRDELPTIILFWFLSDTDGVLVLMPLLLAAAGHVPTVNYRQRWKELAGLAITVLHVATVVYGYYGLNPGNPLPTYLMFPLAIWAVLRFDAVIVGMVLFAAIAFGISGTLTADAGANSDVLHAQLLELQTFIGVLAATCILISAFSRQEAASRARVDALAKSQQEKLEEQVAARTAELQAVNAELSAFNRAVSHDLRTPLNGFFGLLELLEHELGDRAAVPTATNASAADTSINVKTYIAGLRSSAQAMQEMITALLSLSLSQHRELARVRVDLTDLCHEVIATLPLPENPAPRIDIEHGMVVSADPVLMHVLVQNLLDNAIKYSGNAPQPAVRVYTQQQGDVRWIIFEDNGIGFGEEGPAGLFEPFRRLNNAQHLRGSGIGLATVRHIVERHGGRVRAERCASGGACFAVCLPGAAV